MDKKKTLKRILIDTRKETEKIKKREERKNIKEKEKPTKKTQKKRI